MNRTYTNKEGSIEHKWYVVDAAGARRTDSVEGDAPARNERNCFLILRLRHTGVPWIFGSKVGTLVLLATLRWGRFLRS
jgi:hypothetical protein